MAVNPGDIFTVGVASAASAGVTRAAQITAMSEGLQDFDSVKLSFHLYDGDSVSLSTSAHSSSADYLDGYASDLFVFNALDATRSDHLWQRFRVLPMEQGWDADGNSTVAVTGVDYKKLLATRILKSNLPGPFVNVDEAQIIKGIVDHVQAQGTGGSGNLGISTATVVNTTRLRTRTEYKVGDPAYGLLDDLSKVLNGPTWRVKPTATADRSLLVQDPSTFATAEQPIVLGDNALTLNRRPGATVATAGFCPGTNATTWAYAEAAGVATDPRGLMEVSRSASTSVVTQAAVAEVASGVLADYNRPVSAWTAELDVGRWLADSGYTPGLLVPLKVPPRVIDPFTPEVAVLLTVRVIELQVEFNSDGALTVKMAAVEV